MAEFRKAQATENDSGIPAVVSLSEMSSPYVEIESNELLKVGGGPMTATYKARQLEVVSEWVQRKFPEVDFDQSKLLQEISNWRLAKNAYWSVGWRVMTLKKRVIV